MASIAREDGAQFVIQAYREQISCQKKTILSQKLRLLTEQYGNFVRVYRKSADNFDLALSRDPGYLLGESIRAYFDYPDNLIFCEQLPDRNQAIVVVVRGGAILLDTKIDLAQLTSELLPFIADEYQYDYVLYGNIPVTTEEDSETKMTLPEGSYRSFRELDSGVFAALPAKPEFQLCDIYSALKDIKFNNSPIMMVLIGLAAVIVIGIAYLILKPAATPKQKVHKPKISIYQRYNQALTTAPPEAILNEMSSTIEDLYFAPGWELRSVHYANGSYSARYSTQNGSVERLDEWAKENKFGFTLASSGVVITVRSQLAGRSRPENVYQINEVVELLIDETDELLGGKSVSLTQKIGHGKLGEQHLTIRFSEASPELLRLIGQELYELPVRIEGIQANITNGLVSGTITLSVWGTR